MKTLFENRYAPITFSFGFVERPFNDASSTFSLWRRHLDAKFSTQTKLTTLTSPLSGALEQLEPLTTPLDRYLLVETQSCWSAIFANGLQVNDVSSPVGYLPTILNCRGLELAWVPDRSKVAGRTGFQIYGAVSFTLYGSKTTDLLNRVRHISLLNDASGWQFSADGQTQPFEKIENYGRSAITERFTPEMLESYCKAIGLDPFNENFYGERCLLAQITGRRASPGATLTIREARPLLHLA